MVRSRMSCAARRPLLSLTLASACACAAFALFPKEAHASNFDLGIDGDANAMLAPDPTKYNLSTLGTGFKIRFGDQFHLLYGIKLTPEVGYAFDHVFAANSGQLFGPENMNRIFAGVRVGVGRWVVPTVYAHVGYGFRSVSQEGTVDMNGSASENGFTFDTGISVEFRLARHLSIGPHAEYVFIDAPVGTSSGPQWLAFGGHLDILF